MFEKSSLEILTAVFICVILSFCSKGSKEQKTTQSKNSKIVSDAKQKGAKQKSREKQSAKSKKNDKGKSRVGGPNASQEIGSKNGKAKGMSAKNKTDKAKSRLDGAKPSKNPSCPKDAQNPKSVKMIINDEAPTNEYLREIMYEGPYLPMDNTVEELYSPAVHERALKNADENLTIHPKFTKYKGNIDEYMETGAYQKELDEFLEALAKPEKTEKSEKPVKSTKDGKSVKEQRVKIIDAVTLVETNWIESDDDESKDPGEAD